MGRGDNYKVFAANDQARKSIQELNSTNIVYLDWAREVLPRSIGDSRLKSTDGNPYHYGLEPRLQFLQMLSEIYDHHQRKRAVTQLRSLPQSKFESSQLSQISISLVVLGLLVLFPFFRTKKKWKVRSPVNRFR